MHIACSALLQLFVMRAAVGGGAVVIFGEKMQSKLACAANEFETNAKNLHSNTAHHRPNDAACVCVGNESDEAKKSSFHSEISYVVSE